MKALFATVALLALTPTGPVQGWDAELVARFERLPVQDEGRVKPMLTYAHWVLTRLNGRASAKVGDRTLPASEWLLEVLFFPERADTYEVFLVENDEVLDAIGVEHAKKNKRDRYAYQALASSLTTLERLGDQFLDIEEKQRTVVQQQVLRLWSSVGEYEVLRHYFDAARPVTDANAKLRAGRRLAIIAPPVARQDQKTWNSLGEIGTIQEPQLLTIFADQVKAMQSWLALPALRDRPNELKPAFLAACDQVEALGRARGELEKVPLEVTYYKLDLVYRSLYAFGLSFVLCAFWWLRPRSAKLRWVTYATTTLATGVLAAAIVLRCILRDRPPVSTLYETILFITAVAGIVGLVVEAIQRRGMALSVTAVLCFAGVYLANRFEVGDARDTMPMLVAVLDTNFWLATHVTSVTIGYSAGLLAAGIAHVYVFGKLLGARKGDRAFYHGIARSTYGVICFGLLFSLIGTILGGIWANDSWGRFWGWDPKENGALLICLAEIAILHGRLGGYLKELGICMAAIANGMIVAASWWGVNLLGIGLHSYGFTSGIAVSLFTFWGIELGVMGLGTIAWLRQRRSAPTAVEKTSAAAPDAVPEPVR